MRGPCLEEGACPLQRHYAEVISRNRQFGRGDLATLSNPKLKRRPTLRLAHLYRTLSQEGQDDRLSEVGDTQRGVGKAEGECLC